jgi:hypothetical protein
MTNRIEVSLSLADRVADSCKIGIRNHRKGASSGTSFGLAATELANILADSVKVDGARLPLEEWIHFSNEILLGLDKLHQ